MIPPKVNQSQTKQVGQTSKPKQLNQLSQSNNVSFDELFYRELVKQQEVKISAHAEKRLKERKIALSQEDFAKINKAVQQAAAKGSKDSLILYRDLALVTSITNRTVITAIDGNNMAEHVFTNIDSAVIVK
ncbi:TIGR02530 family flagellar biosynthesis protein [Desulforamulus reducens]|uniref:TIGR02530 family flagellar biosynthesis protein n=1 Tax=Desulforamulus reducens TaxID=59610 RepID=UPI0012EA3945|nr:TIGR02530 family flagellar biosynthesis protein [Desulforamulus reducens]